MTPKTVLDFWFAEENRPFQFAATMDSMPKSRSISDIWQQAARGELSHWRDTLQGRLAESLFLINFHAICSATALKRLPKIRLHSSLPKKPFVNPASPTSSRTNAISC